METLSSSKMLVQSPATHNFWCAYRFHIGLSGHKRAHRVIIMASEDPVIVNKVLLARGNM